MTTKGNPGRSLAEPGEEVIRLHTLHVWTPLVVWGRQWFTIGIMQELQGLAQLVGVFAFLAGVSSYQLKSRSAILSRQRIAALTFAIHYYLLGAYVGAGMACIVALRDYVFEQKNKKSWAHHAVWVFVFIGFTVGTLAFNWEGYVSIFPVVATMLATYAFWQDSPAVIRVYVSAAASLWLPYAALIGSYPSIISHIFVIISVNIAMSRLDRQGKPQKRHAHLHYQAHTDAPYFKAK